MFHSYFCKFLYMIKSHHERKNVSVNFFMKFFTSLETFFFFSFSSLLTNVHILFVSLNVILSPCRLDVSLFVYSQVPSGESSDMSSLPPSSMNYLTCHDDFRSLWNSRLYLINQGKFNTWNFFSNLLMFTI